VGWPYCEEQIPGNRQPIFGSEVAIFGIWMEMHGNIFVGCQVLISSLGCKDFERFAAQLWRWLAG